MKIKSTLLLFFILVTTASCTVDVPDTDIKPPQFSFTISGDGFTHTFTQDDDFNSFELNLKENFDYVFTYVGTDKGGLKELFWQFPGNLSTRTVLTLPEQLPEGWRRTSRYEAPEYEDGIKFEGDMENPVYGTSLQGEFLVYSDYKEYLFNFSAMDYGGTSGEENTSLGRLDIHLVGDDEPTELIYDNAVE